MIETDYDNAQIVLKRDGSVKHIFKFKEFVSAKQFKPVNQLRNRLSILSKQEKPLSEDEMEKLDIEFYTLCTETALTNPLPYDEALDIMTTSEIGKLAEEVLIFLINWSSIEAVKQFGTQLSEMKKKEPKP